MSHGRYLDNFFQQMFTWKAVHSDHRIFWQVFPLRIKIFIFILYLCLFFKKNFPLSDIIPTGNKITSYMQAEIIDNLKESGAFSTYQGAKGYFRRVYYNRSILTLVGILGAIIVSVVCCLCCCFKWDRKNDSVGWGVDSAHSGTGLVIPYHPNNYNGGPWSGPHNNFRR